MMSSEAQQPQHPLPEEIRKMNRDETVCKFCGVSYLIHSEIKALEDKLRACQKELKKYQGSEEREEKLKVEITSLRGVSDELKNKCTEQEKLIESLQASLNEKAMAQEKIMEEKRLSEENLKSAMEKIDTLKEKSTNFLTALGNCMKEIEAQRKSLQDLREISSEDTSLLWKDAKTALKHFSDFHIKEIQKVKVELQDKENSLLSAKLKEDGYVQQLKNLEAGQAGLVSLRNDIGSLQSQIKQQETELQQCKERNRELIMEVGQYKDTVQKQSSELEQAHLDKQNKESSAKQARVKLENDLKQKESLIIKLEVELKELREMYEQKLFAEQEVRQKSASANSRVDDMKQELTRVKGDVEALKNEREMMITAHQNQMEQLRESFKRKAAETDKWEAKLNDALQEARRKHDKEIQELEAKLKESFVMELQIEKQKMDELIEKTTKSSRAGETLVKSQLAQQQHKHKSEVADLHRQIAENKARGRETEDSLRREVESLKKIIQDLEMRLSRLGSDDNSFEVKENLQKTQTNLADVHNEKIKLERDVKAAKDEISFLQDTVRRECEERFELTEALSVVKEELLAFKRRPSTSNRNISSAASNASAYSQSSARGSRSDNIEFYKQATPRDLDQKNRMTPTSSRDKVDAKPLTVGFQGGVGGGKEKAENLETTRKRIAQLMGRK